MDFTSFRKNARPSAAEAAKLQANFKKQCKKAASALYEANVLIVVTGAGFSAYSGLAVYADVANVPAYRNLGVSYHDLCQPHWLQAAPSLFFGFWGQCFNDYRVTKPHNGYNIIAKWRDDKNNPDNVNNVKHKKSKKCKKTIADRIRKRIRKERGEDDEDDDAPAFLKTPAYPVQGDPAGAFFCYTSNVDAHWFDVCHAQEIHECHGNVELWQCADPYECGSGIWRAPVEHRFLVDQETMEAPPSKSTTTTTHACTPSPPSTGSSSEEEEEENSDDDSIDRIFQKLDVQKKKPYDWEKHRRKLEVQNNPDFYDWEDHRRKRKRNQSNHKQGSRAPKRQKINHNSSNDNVKATPVVVPVIGHVLGKGSNKSASTHARYNQSLPMADDYYYSR